MAKYCGLCQVKYMASVACSICVLSSEECFVVFDRFTFHQDIHINLKHPSHKHL